MESQEKWGQVKVICYKPFSAKFLITLELFKLMARLLLLSSSRLFSPKQCETTFFLGGNLINRNMRKH